MLIGHEVVDEATRAQHDLKSAVLPKGNYLVFLTKKGPVQEVVPQAWADIWAYFQSAPEQRAYTGDFELYERRDFDPANAQVQIYIAIR